MTRVVATPPATVEATRRDGGEPPPSPPNRSSAWLVAMFATSAGVAAALAPPSPTGRPTVDAVIVGVSAGAVTAAGARAPAWALVLAACSAVAIAVEPVAIAAGAIALVLALASSRRPLVGAPLAAISTGLAVNVMARAELGVTFGLTSLISIAACVVVFFAGVRRHSRLVRRTVYVASAAVIAFAAVSAVALGLVALRARHAFSEGVRAAEQAIASLEYGDYEAAADGFERAAASLEQARAELSSSPWVVGAGFVPVVAQHYDAAVDLSDAGASGSAVVADALGDIDLETLRIERGRVDLAAVAALGGPLGRVEVALEDLHSTVERSDSRWLIGPVEYEITDFRESIAAHFPQLEDALSAVELSPQLLGADAPRSYLVLFTNPVEARGMGGGVAGHAELLVENGQISVGSFGDPAGDATFDDLTMTADFPIVGEAARDIYAGATGRTVDGVIALDPYVLAALLGYTGPIQVPAFDREVDQYSTAWFLLREQFTGSDGGQPIDATNDVAVRTTAAVLAGTLPDPPTLARDLGALAGDRRLLMWSADPEAQQLLEQVGLDGSIPELDGREGWAVTVSNVGGNKIDSFLSTALFYESSVDPVTGRTSAVIRVELTNTAPASGLPADVIGNDLGLPDGTSRLDVSAYSSLALTGATSDGRPLSVESGTESGWNVSSQVVDISAGDVVVLEFQVEGVVAQAGDLVTWQQPLSLEVSTS